MRQIPPPAYQLYTYYCSKRDHRTGGFKCPNPLTATETGMDRSQVRRLRELLVKNGWIEEDQADFIKPKKGDFLEMDERIERRKTPTRVGTVSPQTGDGASPNPTPPGTERPQTGTVSPQTGDGASPHIRKPAHVPAHQPMHAYARVRAGEFTPADLALLGILGWGMAPNRERGDRVKLAVDDLHQLATDYGQDYAPTPERIARFPDYAALTMTTFGPNAVVNHWKRFVDWDKRQSDGTSNNKANTGTGRAGASHHRESRAERNIRESNEFVENLCRQIELDEQRNRAGGSG